MSKKQAVEEQRLHDAEIMCPTGCGRYGKPIDAKGKDLPTFPTGTISGSLAHRLETDSEDDFYMQCHAQMIWLNN